MPYGDIGTNMNKARVAEAVRGLIKFIQSKFREALAEQVTT